MDGPPPGCRWIRGDDDVRLVLGLCDRGAANGPRRVGEVASPLLDSNGVPVETVLTTLLNALARGPGRALARARRLPRHRAAPRSTRGSAFLLDHRRRSSTWFSSPAPIRRSPWLAFVRAATWSRSAPRTCGSPSRRPSAYLNGPMGLGLTAGDVAALEGRTEGWIAALQLAALSIGGRRRPGRVHRGVRRRRPVHRRLPRRRGPRASARRDPAVPARDLDPRSPDRVRCATPSPEPTTAAARSRRSSGRTCSSSRSTIAGAGTAITTCSRTCFVPDCWPSSQT